MSRSGGLVAQEQANLSRAMDYRQVNSLPEMWAIAASTFPEIPAAYDPHAEPAVQWTYRQVYGKILQFAAGLQSLGIQAQADDFPTRVALFADNSPRWMVADQGILRAGGVNVVRGAQADPGELRFILQNSAAVGLVVQDLALLKKLQAGLADTAVKFIVLLSDEAAPEMAGLQSLTFQQLLDLGAAGEPASVPQDRNTLATLMYTSGTSGMPKGVMLTHGNLLAQVNAAAAVVVMQPGQKCLSILPIWHAYERAFEYLSLAQGATQVYTNIRYVKQDLKQYQPDYMVGVPRLWESIYEGIQKQFRDQPEKKQKLVNFFLGSSQRYINARRTLQKLTLDNLEPSLGQQLAAMAQVMYLWPVHQLGDRLVYSKVRDGLGGNLKFVVSGGGSIADHLEDFFELVGIDILGGYGLTETAPITNVRRPWRNLRGGDGQPFPETEIRIVDPETRQDRPTGTQGLVLIRGPQVMQGYFRNPEATQKALDPERWFDSGDLGLVTAQNDLVITGRAKDTIVLTNGENIEPQPIEDACLSSPYIDQIMLVGQDQKSLGALVVPNLEVLKQKFGAAVAIEQPQVQDLFKAELTRLVKERPGFRSDERIGPFRLLSEPFSIDNAMLTQTLKVKRNVVGDRYASLIQEMFK